MGDLSPFITGKRQLLDGVNLKWCSAEMNMWLCDPVQDLRLWFFPRFAMLESHPQEPGESPISSRVIKEFPVTVSGVLLLSYPAVYAAA